MTQHFTATDEAAILVLVGASKVYQTGDNVITAPDKTDLELQNSALTLIMGPSGSGKTTLLSIIGCLI